MSRCFNQCTAPSVCILAPTCGSCFMWQTQHYWLYAAVTKCLLVSYLFAPAYLHHMTLKSQVNPNRTSIGPMTSLRVFFTPNLLFPLAEPSPFPSFYAPVSEFRILDLNLCFLDSKYQIPTSPVPIPPTGWVLQRQTPRTSTHLTPM